MEKIFYTDPMCQSFEAQVVSCRQRGDRYAIELSRTAFFPGGGGQPADQGYLAGGPVEGLLEEGERIFHLCAFPLPVGETVTGSIDFEARFDAMQQHTGEHILAGLLHQKFGYHNVGFHLGAQVVEVDFDGPIEAEELRQIEQRANAIVCRDLPLKCWTPSPEELEKQVYRTKKALPWPVRLVEIPLVDACACCGVHVVRTGQVGLIKILSCTKFHRGVRLEIVCGGRAWAAMDRLFRENRQVSQLLSVPMTETGGAVERLLDQLGQEKGRAAALEKELLERIAQGCGPGDALCRRDGLSSGAQRTLCELLQSKSDGLCCVVSQGEKGTNVCILGPADRVKEVGDLLRTQLHARCGGRPGSLQGSVPAPVQEVETLLWQFCR